MCLPLTAQDTVRYEFSGDTLTRLQGSARETIGCTDAEGTGPIHAVAKSPTGTVYVAAGRGLFSLSDDVRHTTPLPLGEGAPTGVIRKLRVDARGTIWIATDTSFGCVEPVHLFGRTLGKAVEFDRYQPAADDAIPELRIVSSDTEPVDGVLRVTVAATGDSRGAPIYAYRNRKRHRFKWQTSPGFAIEGFEPGKQRLDFVVFDQDLRRSKAVTLEVDVPYPRAFSKRFLLSAVGISLVCILGFLLFRARRLGGGKLRYTRALLSTFLVYAVGLQLLVGVIPHGRSWPFVGFAMYTNRYDAGEHIYKPVLLGVRADHSTIIIRPEHAGYASDGHWQALIPLVYDGDEVSRRFLDAYNRAVPEARLRGFVVHDTKHRLTAEGPVKVAPVVMRVFPRGVLGDR